jgi:hypothetical protein
MGFLSDFLRLAIILPQKEISNRYKTQNNHTLSLLSSKDIQSKTLPFGAKIGRITGMKNHEIWPGVHHLLEAQIKRGRLILPNGKSVSDLSEPECYEIQNTMGAVIPAPPELSEWPDSLLRLWDPFFSVSDPVERLLILSRILEEGYGTSLEGYTSDCSSGLIEIHKEGVSKHSAYEETAFSILSDTYDLIHEAKYFLAVMYGHSDIICSAPEVTPLIYQALAILELLVDKAEEALAVFADTLKYYVYKAVLDKTGKWHCTEEENESRKPEKLELQLYEHAFEEIDYFAEWVEENKIAYRLAELGAILKVHCQIKVDNPEAFARMEARQQEQEVARLLERDITKTIISVLGKERKKRSQIVNETEYYEGGYMGATLSELKRFGILQHATPYYSVNPAYYKRLGICPDKDGQ